MTARRGHAKSRPLPPAREQAPSFPLSVANLAMEATLLAISRGASPQKSILQAARALIRAAQLAEREIREHREARG